MGNVINAFLLIKKQGTLCNKSQDYCQNAYDTSLVLSVVSLVVLLFALLFYLVLFEKKLIDIAVLLIVFFDILYSCLNIAWYYGKIDDTAMYYTSITYLSVIGLLLLIILGLQYKNFKKIE